MIESVCYIHSRGIRHSDLRLEQWFVDLELNARLGDFNASGHDADPVQEIEKREKCGVAPATHFLPGDPCVDSTVEMDIFALGSALYELETDQCTYAQLGEQHIEELFRGSQFPHIGDLDLNHIIQGCWHQRYSDANETLAQVQKLLIDIQ